MIVAEFALSPFCSDDTVMRTRTYLLGDKRSRTLKRRARTQRTTNLGHFYHLVNYCSGLNQGHIESLLVVLNKSTSKQKYTHHTHGYWLKKEDTGTTSDIELKSITFWVCIPILHFIYITEDKHNNTDWHRNTRFATRALYRTHHCTLYSVTGSSLYTCHKTHWLMLIYKTHLGPTLPFLRYLLQPSSSPFCQSHSVTGPQCTDIFSVRCS